MGMSCILIAVIRLFSGYLFFGCNSDLAALHISASPYPISAVW